MVTSPLTEKIHPSFKHSAASTVTRAHVTSTFRLDVEEDYTILIDNMIADGVLEMT